jgi:hypothetical protein
MKDLEPSFPLLPADAGILPLPGQGAAALGAFHVKTRRPLLVGLAVPAGRADAKSAGTGAGPASPAATAAATATPAASGAASLAASWTSLLCKNCHLNSSLAAETSLGRLNAIDRQLDFFELLLFCPLQV